MALGRAFIEVHADTAPFARELGRELDRILRQAEKEVSKSSTRIGEKIGDGAGKGIEKKSKSIGRGIDKGITEAVDSGIFDKLAKGIIDSIDDGLSGLPAELKIALGAALVAVSPFIGAAIAGLVSATVIAAFAGLGVLIASQFQVVQDNFKKFASTLKNFFVTIGNVFVDPINAAFVTIQERVFAMRGWFEEIFAVSATFIGPLVDAVTGFIEGLLPGLLDTLRNVRPVLDAIVQGAVLLGRTIGEALRIISGSNDVDQGFLDLVHAVNILILSAAILIRALTEIYGFLRAISQLASGDFTAFAQQQAENALATDDATAANGEFEQSLLNLIAPTDDETKALQDANKALEGYVGLQFTAARANIDFEQSLDDMSLALKDGSKTLDINKQAGRDNRLAILDAADALIKQRDETIRLTGKTEDANATFVTNRQRLEDAAVAAGISREKFRDLTSTMLDVPSQVPISVPVQSINAAIRRLQVLAATAAAAISAAARAAAGSSSGAQAVSPHAMGGVFSTPHVGLVAEAGPEAIIPLNNPGRAAQIMNQAGLSQLASPNVNVYIGNDQIQAYIATEVSEQMTMAARAMSYGTRSF